MMSQNAGSEGPIDYWREVARRGVMALGFSIARHSGETWMMAELVAPQEGSVRRAAHAAMEIHQLIAMESSSAAWAAREALSASLEMGPAARELAIYQGLLLERLWREIKDAPAARLSQLTYPYED